MMSVYIRNVIVLVFLYRCCAEDTKTPLCKPREVIREVIDNKGVKYPVAVYRCTGSDAGQNNEKSDYTNKFKCINTSVSTTDMKVIKGGQAYHLKVHTHCDVLCNENCVCPIGSKTYKFTPDCEIGLKFNDKRCRCEAENCSQSSKRICIGKGVSILIVISILLVLLSLSVIIILVCKRKYALKYYDLQRQISTNNRGGESVPITMSDEEHPLDTIFD